MEDPTPIPPLAQKRPFEDDAEPPVTTPVKQIRSEASTPLSVLSVRTPSPIRGKVPISNGPQSSLADTLSSQSVPTSSSTQQTKRRKLTQQEKDDQRLEKEAKVKARAEKKAQKEAEDKLKAEQKAQKDEEKRKKNEEKEEEKRQKEEEKLKKEEEKRQKEEEKLKKERSQMKLNSFFAKPKPTVISGGQAVVELSQTSTAAPVSLPSTSGACADSVTASPQKMIVKNARSDYERYFLPFSLPAHTILAPTHSLHEKPDQLAAAQGRLDALVAQHVSTLQLTRDDLKKTFQPRQRRNMRSPTIVEVVERHNASSSDSVDLTKDNTTTSQDPLEMLREIPMKYLHFPEDVRPPYYGTYTKSYTNAETVRLARNPHSRVRQDTNYDYDSEAEWEEPEEGEDLNSDGEEDIDDDAEDDMDGFLDDEEDPQLKRRLISGDLVPISTGLCWEGSDHVSRLNDGSDAICTDFREFKMGFLFESQPRAIDPFSTAYWTPEPVKAPVTISTAIQSSINGHMQPPRAPLTQRNMNGLLNTMNGPKMPVMNLTSKPAKAKRMVPDEQLPAFKAEVLGKDLTKIGMIEALKKAFPKLPKDAINNTLSVVAARVGPTEKEKRWVLIDP